MSPRGTTRSPRRLRVLGRGQDGYFGDIETVIEGWSGSGRRAARRRDQADMAYPSPGVFTSNLEAERSARLRLGDGRLRCLRLRLPQGETTGDRDGSRREDDRPRRRFGGRPSVDPMIAQAGGLDPASWSSMPIAGVTAWGQALQQGQADAALSWAGLRAQWRSEGLDFDYSWARTGRSSRPTRSSFATLTSRTRPSPTSTAGTCAAGRWDWSSDTRTRAPRPRSP